MSNSRNQFEIIGNLGAQPESKKLDNDGQLTRLFIITNQKWKDRETGELKERSESFNVTVFGTQAKFLSEYARKGDKVLVKGELRSGEWTDKNTGQKRIGLELVVTNGRSHDCMIFGKPQKSNDGVSEPVGDEVPEYDQAS